MPLDGLVELWGEQAVAVLGGLVIGMVFGFVAERSRFCLRAAVVDFVRGRFGKRLAVWAPGLFRRGLSDPVGGDGRLAPAASAS